MKWNSWKMYALALSVAVAAGCATHDDEGAMGGTGSSDSSTSTGGSMDGSTGGMGDDAGAGMDTDTDASGSTGSTGSDTDMDTGAGTDPMDDTAAP